MTIRISSQPAGDNGGVQKITLDNGDTGCFRLEGIVDFLNRGIVFMVMPDAGSSVTLEFSPDPATDLESFAIAVGSPFTAKAVIHQITPFNGVRINSASGAAQVKVMFPFEQAPELVQVVCGTGAKVPL